MRGGLGRLFDHSHDLVFFIYRNDSALVKLRFVGLIIAHNTRTVIFTGENSLGIRQKNI